MHCFLTSIVFFVLLIASARAQPSSEVAELAAELPTCALDCLTALIPESPCSLTNATCICTDKSFFNGVGDCVAANCTVKQALTTQNLSMTLCAAYKPVGNISNEGVITAAVMGTIALAAVILRVIGRWTNMSGRLGTDDYSILCSLAFAITVSVIAFPLRENGLGEHMWKVPFNEITNCIYFFFIEEVMYTWAITFTKLSLLFFYLRIFPDQKFRRIVYIVMGIVLAYLGTFMIAQFLQCRPLNQTWEGWDNEQPKSCTDFNAQNWAAAGINICLDLTICLLPLPELWKLNLTMKKKIGILLMFSVGLFVTLVSILRLRTLVAIGKTTDFTYDVVSPGIWSIIEMDIGILCACMPGIRALLKNVFPKILGSTRNKNSYGYRNTSSGGRESNPQQYSSREDIRKDGGRDEFIEIDDIESNKHAGPSSGDTRNGNVCHVKAMGKAIGGNDGRSNSLNPGRNNSLTNGRNASNVGTFGGDPTIYTGEGINVFRETRVYSDNVPARNFSRLSGIRAADNLTDPGIYRAEW